MTATKNYSLSEKMFSEKARARAALSYQNSKGLEFHERFGKITSAINKVLIEFPDIPEETRADVTGKLHWKYREKILQDEDETIFKALLRINPEEIMKLEVLNQDNPYTEEPDVNVKVDMNFLYDIIKTSEKEGDVLLVLTEFGFFLT